MNLRVHTEAAAEVRAAAVYYDEVRAGLGDEFLSAVVMTFDRIVESPNTHSFESQALRCRRRRVPRFPYRVVFLAGDATVEVVAVPHDRRRPRYWQRRVR